MKSDYELMMGAKANDSEMMNELYHRYIPLIFKHSRRLKMRDSDQKSDYAQDAFLRCLKAVEYVNIDKIRDIETWCFHMVFDWFLQNLDKRYRKVLYHTGAELSMSIFDNDNGEEFMTDYEHTLGFEDNSITEFEREESKNEFMNSLSPIRRKILLERQNGVTIAAIAKELNVSYGTVHGHIFNMKKLAETIIL